MYSNATGRRSAFRGQGGVPSLGDAPMVLHQILTHKPLVTTARAITAILVVRKLGLTITTHQLLMTMGLVMVI